MLTNKAPIEKREYFGLTINQPIRNTKMKKSKKGKANPRKVMNHHDLGLRQGDRQANKKRKMIKTLA